MGAKIAGIKESIHVCVTGSPCCTVEKNCIGEIRIKKLKKRKTENSEW